MLFRSRKTVRIRIPKKCLYLSVFSIFYPFLAYSLANSSHPDSSSSSLPYPTISPSLKTAIFEAAFSVEGLWAIKITIVSFAISAVVFIISFSEIAHCESKGFC